jgi:hypothetical protein
MKSFDCQSKGEKMANKKIFIGIIAAAVIFTALFTSCDIDVYHDDYEDDLILKDGYAWITDDIDVDFYFDHFFEIDIDIEQDAYGLIFNKNDRVAFIEKDSDGNWYVVKSIRYDVDHDEIKMGNEWCDFDVDSDELSIDGDFFERKHIGLVRD